MIDFIKKLVSALSDAELATLRSFVVIEEDIRFKKKLDTYPALDETEKGCVMMGNRVAAIKFYKERNNVSLYEAHKVVTLRTSL